MIRIKVRHIFYVLFTVSLLYIIAGFCTAIYDEFNDVDDYRRVIIDKRAGVVEWTTSTGGKYPQTIRHQDGAIWIKAQSVIDKNNYCTWAERNPFNADHFEVGATYDFVHSGDKCAEDLTTHGAEKYVFLFMLWLICAFIVELFKSN